MSGRMPKIAWMWPGLPQLWERGSWWGLALATAFALLLNVLLVATLVWTEWFDDAVLSSGWLMVAVLWVASAGISLSGLAEPPAESAQHDWFIDAQAHYLKGNWYEAETLLGLCLKRNRRDAEARLLLATLRRRTGRIEEAIEQLDLLERQDGAAAWQLESRRERELALRDQAEAEEDADNGEETPVRETKEAA